MKAEWNQHQGHISLHEEKPSLVQVYIEWLYTNKYLALNDLADLIQLDASTCSSDLAEFYLLGEFLQDTKFQHFILHSMLLACHLPTAKDITSIYEGTPNGSPARRLYVDLFSRDDKSEQFKKDADNLPVEFKKDLCIRFMRRIARRPDTEDYAIPDASAAKTSSGHAVQDPSTNTINRGRFVPVDDPRRHNESRERIRRTMDAQRKRRLEYRAQRVLQGKGV
jgi:hypothetical protein